MNNMIILTINIDISWHSPLNAVALFAAHSVCKG